MRLLPLSDRRETNSRGCARTVLGMVGAATARKIIARHENVSAWPTGGPEPNDPMTSVRGRGRSAMLATALTATAVFVLAAALPAQRASAASAAPVRHVWVIVLENKEFEETFGAGSLFAPYLTQTLPSEGALVPHYFGTGHSSADNYIAMIAGQPPTFESKEDCPDPLTTLAESSDANGVAEGGGGCVYPAKFKTIADQLVARKRRWRAYAQNIPSPCSLAHDAPGDYARKHNPFPFFLSIRESGQCAANDVPLTDLAADLKRPANINFIFPDQCADGHSDCTATGTATPIEEQQHELEQADAFLKEWVPRITSTRAFRRNGLLAIVFDEGDTTLSCCEEPDQDPDGSSPGGEEGIPGAGGGQTGAVLLSPFIKPGTVSEASYNHYSLLASIEQMFRLARLGEANLPGTTTFGRDIFTAAP